MGAQQEEDELGLGLKILFSLLGAAMVAFFVVGGVFIAKDYTRESSSKEPEYTLAITGADGLAAAHDRPTLSPVFNMTVHINNTGNKIQRVCIDDLSTAVVSYGDAFLAKGSVPTFCAEMGQENEVAATAWGQDVVVPPFLQERLAGEVRRSEGEMDVQVTTPGYSHDAVLVCKAKIGGVPSPCRLDYVYPRRAPAADD